MVKNCLYRMIAAFRHFICSVFLVLFYISVSSQGSFDIEVQTGYSSSLFDITNQSRVNYSINSAIYKDRMIRLRNSTYLVGIGYNFNLRHRLSLTYRHHIVGSEVPPLNNNSNIFIIEQTKLFEIGLRYDFAPIKQLSIQVSPLVNIFDRFDGISGIYSETNERNIVLHSTALPFDKSIFKALEYNGIRAGIKIGMSYMIHIDENLNLFFSGTYQLMSDYITSPAFGITVLPHGSMNEYIFSLGFRFKIYKFKKK